MFRYHALGGVSAIAIQAALLASADIANAQSGDAKVCRPSPSTRRGRRPGAPRQPQPDAATAGDRRPPHRSGNGRSWSSIPPARRQCVARPAGGRQRFQLPQQSTSITAKQIEETINLKDPEDAVKYFPSLFVRKRNDGDNQAVLATRSWGSIRARAR